MRPEPSISAETGRRADRAAIARAKADHGAGRGVEHDVVADWLKTWGTTGRLPSREWLQAQDG